MPDWGDLLARAQKVRLGLEGARGELQSQQAVVRSADGSVEVVVNGLQKVLAVYVSPGALAGRGEDEAARIIAATVNEALEQARSQALKKLSEALGTDLNNWSGLLGGFMGGGFGGGF